MVKLNVVLKWDIKLEMKYELCHGGRNEVYEIYGSDKCKKLNVTCDK